MKRIFTFTAIGLVVLFFIAYPGFAKKYLNTPFLEKVVRTPPLEEGAANSVENKTTYKDPLISVTWNPEPTAFYFTLNNLSGENFEIIWSECYLKDSFSKYTVIHEGMRYPREISPTRLAAGKSLRDFMYPTAFVKYERSGRISNLRYKGIYKKKLKEKDVAENAFVPETFVVTLTLTAGDNRYAYEFHFKTELEEK